MKNEAAGTPGAIAEELKPTTVQDAADKGLKVQEGSYSELQKIRAKMERARYIADQGAGRMMQDALTPRAGTDTIGLDQGKVKTELSETMRNARARGGSQVAATALGLQTGKVSDTLGVDAAGSMRDAIASLKDLPTILEALHETLKGIIPASTQSVIRQQAADQKNREAQPGGGAAPVAPGTPANDTLHVIGKITIDCPHCGKPHEASNQFKIYSGPSGQTGQ
jgi:hypothetical protein